MSHVSRPRKEMPGSFRFYTALASTFLSVHVTCVSSLNALNSQPGGCRSFIVVLPQSSERQKQVAQGHQQITKGDGTPTRVSQP